MRLLHAGIHWGLLFLVVALGGLAGFRVLVEEGPERCGYSIAYLPDESLFLVGVAAFFAGHLLQISDRTARPPKSNANWSAAGPWRRKAMQTVFLALAAIAALEAIGTARVAVSEVTAATVEPITFYTRCAIYHDFANGGGLLSVATIAAVFFLAGHWLWPEGSPEG